MFDRKALLYKTREGEKGKGKKGRSGREGVGVEKATLKNQIPCEGQVLLNEGGTAAGYQDSGKDSGDNIK